MRSFLPSRRDHGFSLVEMLVCVALLGIGVLGVSHLLLVQAKQVTRDRFEGDVLGYAQRVMNVATEALAASVEVRPHLATGFELQECLEFRYGPGLRNLGRRHFTYVNVTNSQRVRVKSGAIQQLIGTPSLAQEADWSRWFPAAEIRPGRRGRYRIQVEKLEIRQYAHDTPLYRQASILNDQAMSKHLDLTLRIDEPETGWSTRRVFRRTVSTPNCWIETWRQTHTGQYLELRDPGSSAGRTV